MTVPLRVGAGEGWAVGVGLVAPIVLFGYKSAMLAPSLVPTIVYYRVTVTIGDRN